MRRNAAQLWPWTFDATRGFNFAELDLELTPAKAAALGVRQIKSGKDVLDDPFGGTRATYVPVGAYTIEVVVGDKTATQAWKITS